MMGKHHCPRQLKNEHEAVAKLLLERNISTRSTDIIGRTPLSYATENKHMSLIALLAQVDPSAVLYRDKFGRSPLLLAAEAGHEAMDFILCHTNIERQSRADIIFRELENVKQVISLIDENFLCQFGGAGLLWAVWNRYYHVAKVLLQKRVDPYVRNYIGVTPLAAAVENNDENMVRCLLASGANPNSQDSIGRAPLSWALLTGNEEIIQLLLEHGVDIHKEIASPYQYYSLTRSKVESWGGLSIPLFIAVLRGSEAIVVTLLRNGAARMPEKNQKNTLWVAACNGNLEIVKLLLQTSVGKHVIQKQLETIIDCGFREPILLFLEKMFSQCCTPDKNILPVIFIAAHRGLDYVVKYALDKGLDCNARRAYNETLLLIAARGGYEAMIRTLLEFGANPGLMNNGGTTPLAAAVKNGRHSVAKLLLEKGLQLSSIREAESLLLLAAENGAEHVVKRILEEWTIDVDLKNNEDGAPLFWAAFYGHEAVVEILLKGQADPNCKLREGWHEGYRPLHLATKDKKLRTFRALLEAGANPELSDDNGRAALSLAAERGWKPDIDLLLRHHAEINMADKHNRTPLFWAVMNGHEAAVQALLDHGSNAATHVLTSANMTALSLARDLGRLNNASLLNGQGHALGHKSNGNPEISEVLLYCDICDLSIQDPDYHFHCPTCGDFDLCAECFWGGLSCKDKLHIIQKRTMRGGKPVILKTIRPWSTDNV